jgi:hypothetical protein
VALEERLSDLRAPGVVGADEQHVLHRSPPAVDGTAVIVSIDKREFNRYK